MKSKLLAIPLSLSLLAAAPATRPATRPVDPDAAAFSASISAVEKLIPRAGALRDPAQREKLAPTAIPAIQNFLKLEHHRILKLPSTVAYFGAFDAKYRAELLVLGGSTDIPGVPELHHDEAREGAKYVLATPDEQAASVAAIGAKLKTNPEDEKAMTTALLMHMLGDAASPQLDAQCKDFVSQAIKVRLAKVPESAATTKALLNKPLILAGTLSDGKNFSTADWKGKVVMVDFWATWCGPCKAGLPHVKDIYNQYHSQGLEIVGVSNDQSGAALTKFLKDDPTMAWPQLYDEKAGAARKWNPLTTQFGVESIPRMFLIDRQGVCRSITARQDMDKLIPKLLAETASTTQPASVTDAR